MFVKSTVRFCFVFIAIIGLGLLPSVSTAQTLRQVIADEASQSLVGLWQQFGDGRILRVSKENAEFFHVTKSITYLDSRASGKPLSQSYALSALSDDQQTLKLWKWDFGSRCEEQFYDEFRRIKELPKETVFNPEKDKRFGDPVFVFNLVCEKFEGHFPHFQRRNFDWQSRKKLLSKRIDETSSEKQLFTVLCDLLRGLEDSHTRIYWSKQKSPFKSGEAKILKALDAAFAKQSQIKDVYRFRGNWSRRMMASVNRFVDKELASCANGRFEWGIIDGNIGYIRNSSISGFSPPGTPRSKELEILEQELDVMIGKLKECKAILLDLSFNSGGYEPAALMIASRFADKRRLAYTLSSAGNPSMKSRKIYVTPRGKFQFTGPVYVLTSNVTVSSGETLVLMLKAFPHVKQLGERTRGCLSSFLNKPIPENFHLTLSNEIYETPAGRIPEGTGVIPNGEFPVFDKDNLESSYPQALKRSIVVIKNSM